MPEATGERGPKPSALKELGRVNIEKTPYQANVKALASQYFSKGKHLKLLMTMNIF